ncbi:MAG TPA: IclR family transcriptional regulator [Actinomycetes bacterium]
MAIQAIERAAAILRELRDSRGLGLTELYERLQLAKGTTFGLLKALQAEGLVAQDRVTGRYQLGPGLLLLGRSYLDVAELRAAAVGWGERLAAGTGEEVRIAIPFEGRALVIHQVVRTADPLQNLEVGVGLPLHATALGKCLLAYTPKSTVAATHSHLEQFTPATITRPEAMVREIRKVLSQSWAIEREEFEVGIAAVGAPVFHASGELAGAVGVTGAHERILTPRREPRAGLAMHVAAVARGMSRELGATRWPVSSTANRG